MKSFVNDLKRILKVKTDRELAELIGVQIRTIYSWKYTETRPGLIVQRIIDKLVAKAKGETK